MELSKHAVQEKRVSLPCGEEMLYRQFGSGPRKAVLLHGNLATSRFFEPFFPYLTGYTLYAPDLRGFGGSTYNRRFDSLYELSEDVSQFCDAVGIEKALFIGWSTGGGVVLELAASRPVLVDKIVLMAGVSYMGFPVPRKDERGRPIPDTYYQTRAEMEQDPKQVVMIREAIENRNEAVLRRIWDRGIYVVKRPPEEEYAVYIEEMLRQRNLNDVYWALSAFNMSHSFNGVSEGSGRISLVKAPVLSLWGAKDYIVERKAVTETVKALVQQGNFAELHIFEDCGHSGITDCPDEFARLIHEFDAEK